MTIWLSFMFCLTNTAPSCKALHLIKEFKAKYLQRVYQANHIFVPHKVFEILCGLNISGTFWSKVTLTIRIKCWKGSCHIAGHLKFIYRRSIYLWPHQWTVIILHAIKSFIYSNTFLTCIWNWWYERTWYYILVIFTISRIFFDNLVILKVRKQVNNRFVFR
jgi:hypothetical protein